MNVIEDQGIDIIEFEGSIQEPETELLEKTLQGLLDVQKKRIIIDLSQVNHVCSSALGMMLTFHKEVKKTGGDIKLVLDTEELLQLFEITMLDKVFDISNNRKEALSAFEDD